MEAKVVRKVVRGGRLIEEKLAEGTVVEMHSFPDDLQEIGDVTFADGSTFVASASVSIERV